MTVDQLVERLQKLQSDGLGGHPVILYSYDEESATEANSVRAMGKNDELPYCKGDHVFYKPTPHVQIS